MNCIVNLFNFKSSGRFYCWVESRAESLFRFLIPGASSYWIVRRELGAYRLQPEDTGFMINGRAFFIKSELSGSMKSDAFEYEIAVTSVRNRRFMLVHFIGESEPKEGCIFVNCVSPLGYEFWNRCVLDTRQTENLAVNRRI